MASVLSAATILGVPAEVYSFGTMYLYFGECVPVHSVRFNFV